MNWLTGQKTWTTTQPALSGFILNIFNRLYSLSFSPSLLHSQTSTCSHHLLCFSQVLVISRLIYFLNSLTLENYYNSAWASSGTCGHQCIPWGTEACPGWSQSCCHLHRCPCHCHCRWRNRSVGSSHSAAYRDRRRHKDKSLVCWHFLQLTWSRAKTDINVKSMKGLRRAQQTVLTALNMHTTVLCLYDTIC